MLDTLPDDVLIFIFSLLDIKDIMQLRSILKINGGNKIIINKLIIKIDKHKIRYRQLCVKCQHHCLTEMTYDDGFVRKWIPYCVIHCPPLLMNNIQLYCTGGIDIEGNPLIIQ